MTLTIPSPWSYPLAVGVGLLVLGCLLDLVQHMREHREGGG